MNPGVFVPLHSHADRETFFVLSGSLEAFAGSEWVEFHVGDIFDAASRLRHGRRNAAEGPARLIIITTPAMARLLKAFARPAAEMSPGAPPAERLLQFTESAARHGHWLAGAKKNCAIGLPAG